MTADAPAKSPKPKRIRASEKALSIALKAATENGLAVDKLLVSGGTFELHFDGVAAPKPDNNDDGLEEWD